MRKSKASMILERDYKSVRIDDRTIIQVKKDVPDQVARERFLKRVGYGPKAPDEYDETEEKTTPHEESVGSLEEMEKVIDEATSEEE